jgi:hypothetical protein
MKINWKRVVIAGIWSELVLLAIWLTARKYAGSAFVIIAVLDEIGLMFLGGLWAARKIESRFVLHGVLVGLVANILFIALTAFYALILLTPTRDIPNTHLLIGIVKASYFMGTVKMLASAAGAYVGGRRRKKLLSAQAG